MTLFAREHLKGDSVDTSCDFSKPFIVPVSLTLFGRFRDDLVFLVSLRDGRLCRGGSVEKVAVLSGSGARSGVGFGISAVFTDSAFKAGRQLRNLLYDSDVCYPGVSDLTKIEWSYSRLVGEQKAVGPDR